MIDERERRYLLAMLESVYQQRYGEAETEAAQKEVLAELERMAERMAETPGGWRDHDDASLAERQAAVLFLAMSDAEREHLEARVDAELAALEARRRCH